MYLNAITNKRYILATQYFTKSANLLECIWKKKKRENVLKSMIS